MGRRVKKKDKEDRISRLPDELIHKTLSFLSIRLAVRTSILSKRWKLIWTTLPFLHFGWYDHAFPRTLADEFDCINNVISYRNHQFDIEKVKLNVIYKQPKDLIKKFIRYAISHNVQYLDLTFVENHPHYKLSTFTSNSIQKLTLEVNLKLLKDCWDLPALTTLDLRRPNDTVSHRLPESCFTCLPSLRNLYLDNFQLAESFTLPALEYLWLGRCNLPQGPCKFSGLLSLVLVDVVYNANVIEFFSGLVSLKYLSLYFWRRRIPDFFISCPRLVDLTISTRRSATTSFSGNIMVLAPKICNFTSVGIFPITFGVSELENVNIESWDSIKTMVPSKKLKQYCRRFAFMFPGLGGAKTLTLDMTTIAALSAISDVLVRFPSPFYNLKYLKLPHGYKESSLPRSIRSYLLGGSPGATVVTTLPRKDMNSQTAVGYLAAQNVLLNETLANPADKHVESQGIHGKVCIDTLGMKEHEEHAVESSGVDAGRVRQVSALEQGFGGLVQNALVAGADNDQVRTCRLHSDIGLWQGHEVNSEFVGLLDLIMKKYPETFEHFTTISKKLCTMKLNMLCTSVNAYMETTMIEIDAEMITEYRALFADLQRSFNVNWLVSHLNYVEQLQFTVPLHHEPHATDSRVTEIQKDYRTIGSLSAAGYTGDGLFSDP